MNIFADLLLKEDLSLLEDKQAFILDKQGPKVWDAYQADKGAGKGKFKDAAAVIKKLAGTSEKYLQWLVNRYVKNEFSLEDLPRIKTSLGDFEKGSKKLEKKDLNQYKGVLELEDALSKLAPEDLKSNNEVEREREAKFFKDKEAKLFYNKGGIKIIVPKTQEASCYFGRGTKWCTAAEKNNMFDSYNKGGGLYIIFTDDGEKYQFHARSGQFATDEDKMLSMTDVLELIKKYPAVKDALKNKAKSSGILGLMDVDTLTDTQLLKLDFKDVMDYMKVHASDLPPDSPMWWIFGRSLSASSFKTPEWAMDDAQIKMLLDSKRGLEGYKDGLSKTEGWRRADIFSANKLIFDKLDDKFVKDALLVRRLNPENMSSKGLDIVETFLNSGDKDFRKELLRLSPELTLHADDPTDEEIWNAYDSMYGVGKETFLKALTNRQREAIRWRERGK